MARIAEQVDEDRVRVLFDDSIEALDYMLETIKRFTDQNQVIRACSLQHYNSFGVPAEGWLVYVRSFGQRLPRES